MVNPWDCDRDGSKAGISGRKTGYTEYCTSSLGERIAVHKDMNGNVVDRATALGGQQSQSQSAQDGRSFADAMWSWLFNFSRMIDNEETPISLISPIAVVGATLYYFYTVYAAWSLNVLEGIAALLIAWLIIPIIGVMAGALAGALVLVKVAIRRVSK